ncbi:MAG: hypothetical protein DCC43_08580 [Candidatus Brocadia sp.]|nr:hypothetical protein [Candidatus Brocadia sp. AMX3]OQZ00846.1 MAG: hypothetical protein B6D35_05030 [Candidatus Brocadia sp. UTAMX2]RIJ99317.1 MAG: hypothetical protein DCC43_08580 [Candidatus Brocadia sp.]
MAQICSHPKLANASPLLNKTFLGIFIETDAKKLYDNRKRRCIHFFLNPGSGEGNYLLFKILMRI